MFGVNGGIFAPVRRFWSGTMRRPALHWVLGVAGGEGFFPNAATPPVNVTFEEVTTFAGSLRPEIITAWILLRVTGAGVGVPMGGGVTTGRLSPPDTRD